MTFHNGSRSFFCLVPTSYTFRLCFYLLHPFLFTAPAEESGITSHKLSVRIETRDELVLSIIANTLGSLIVLYKYAIIQCTGMLN